MLAQQEEQYYLLSDKGFNLNLQLIVKFRANQGKVCIYNKYKSVLSKDKSHACLLCKHAPLLHVYTGRESSKFLFFLFYCFYINSLLIHTE
jgi:hypothetical protein